MCGQNFEIYEIMVKCEVKMVGYWPGLSFLRVYAQVANHSARFDSSCPLTELAI